MEEFEIEFELDLIREIHPSFDEENPITYVLFLERNKEKLNEKQIELFEEEIKRLKKKQEFYTKKMLEKFTDPLSRVPLLEKIPKN